MDKQDKNFRRQFVKRLTFGLVQRIKIPERLVKRIKIPERMHRILSTLSRRRRVSFRIKVLVKVKDLQPNDKSENIGMKVVLTKEHKTVACLCRSDRNKKSAEPKDDIINTV